MARSPSSWQAWITRTAISPRFATRTERKLTAEPYASRSALTPTLNPSGERETGLRSRGGGGFQRALDAGKDLAGDLVRRPLQQPLADAGDHPDNRHVRLAVQLRAFGDRR